jgi:hypothetical protein
MATKPSTGRAAEAGNTALDRLSGSIDAAQDALNDLRRELSKGGREVLKDLDTLLSNARKNLRSTQRTLIKDLDDMQKAATGKRSSARASSSGATAKRTTTSSKSSAPRPRSTRQT